MKAPNEGLFIRFSRKMSFQGSFTCRFGGEIKLDRNRGTPKSSILIGFSTIKHPFSDTPIFGNAHMANVLRIDALFGLASYNDPISLTVQWKIPRREVWS